MLSTMVAFIFTKLQSFVGSVQNQYMTQQAQPSDWRKKKSSIDEQIDK